MGGSSADRIASETPAGLAPALAAAVAEGAPRVVQWRRTLHARPELAYQERETAALVAAELRRMGAEVQEGVGGTTGVLGQLRGTGPGRARPGAGAPGGAGLEAGRVVAIRADMDALPIEGGDPKDVPYRTAVLGARHVCGHDAHVAMALGVAQALARLRDRWSGTIKLLFEPAEECLGTDLRPGAVALVEAGVLHRPAVDAVLALHVFPEYPVGTVAVRPGVIMTGMDLLDLEVLGEEAHSSTPQKGVDAIVAAAQVVLALQTLASRETDPGQAVAVNIGSIQGGQGPRNLLADRVTLRGLVRAATPAARRAARPCRAHRPPRRRPSGRGARCG